jgi:hypothetical protein
MLWLNAGEMRALLPVFSTMLRFSPGDVARCQESAAKWEAAAGGALGLRVQGCVAPRACCVMSGCAACMQRATYADVSSR